MTLVRMPRSAVIVRPKALSSGEELFAMHAQVYDIEVVREFQFDPDRKWRADFAMPDHRILIEIEGGIWSGGRHSRGSGMQADMIKYNHAALAGYRVFRFSTEMVNSAEAIDFVRRAISQQEGTK